MFSLQNRVALVTGSARGIGFSIAETLAKNDARVMLADVDALRLSQAVDALSKEGLAVDGVPMDVSSDESIHAAMQKVESSFGGLDILVNNAGVLSALGIEEMTRGEWDRVLQVNLAGVFFVTQAALPYLKKGRSPRIINISSLAGRNGGISGSMCYAASKGAVNTLTRAMAKQLSPYRITANAICPGTTETEILKGYDEQAIQKQIDSILLKRLGKPNEIAAAACYLASEEAGFVTGVLLDVNGGAYMG